MKRNRVNRNVFGQRPAPPTLAVDQRQRSTSQALRAAIAPARVLVCLGCKAGGRGPRGRGIGVRSRGSEAESWAGERKAGGWGLGAGRWAGGLNHWGPFGSLSFRGPLGSLLGPPGPGPPGLLGGILEASGAGPKVLSKCCRVVVSWQKPNATTV